MIEKWYRVLLWAYPRRFRRVRAQEMLTTLLDAARPGQRRPEWRDAANVVLRGLRYRFAVPRGAGYVSAAIVFALLCAVLVTAGVAFAAWRTAAPAPQLSTALAVAGRAVPTGEPSGPAGISPGSVWVSVPVPAGGLAPARDRLAADGWQVTEDGSADTFRATRSDTRARVSVSGSTLLVEVSQSAPGWLGAGLVAGTVVGLTGGWLLAGRVLRGFRRHGPLGRLAMLVFGGPSLVVAVQLVLRAVILAVVVAEREGEAFYLVTGLVESTPSLPAAVVGLLGAVLVGVVPTGRSVEEQRRAPDPATWRYLAWSATTVHLVFMASWCVVLALYLRQVAITDDVYLGDPKDVVTIYPVYIVLTRLLLFGVLLSPALLFASVPLLVTGRRYAGVTWTLLLVAALTAVSLPILMFTPLGQDVSTWWVD